jgi:thiamine pyrophosphate-dependent acetolactate synthase large subunit-like protein
MGQAVPLGIGLALSKPGLGVIVISGDGGLLMNLGCLVTLAEQNVAVSVVLIDNGLYEVTGGQQTVGAGRVDFAMIAKASGIGHVATFDDSLGWESVCEKMINHPSQSFAWCKVVGERGKQTPTAPEPMESQIQRLRRSIGS